MGTPALLVPPALSELLEDSLPQSALENALRGTIVMKAAYRRGKRSALLGGMERIRVSKAVPAAASVRPGTTAPKEACTARRDLVAILESTVLGHHQDLQWSDRATTLLKARPLIG